MTAHVNLSYVPADGFYRQPPVTPKASGAPAASALGAVQREVASREAEERELRRAHMQRFRL